MSNHKLKRIESDIIKYLSNILLTETRDDFLKTITLTNIEVNNDLSIAKVYFTSISDLDKSICEKEMNEASPFLRGRLAKVLEVRSIPELKFIYDDTIEYQTKIERIIKDINKEG